MHPTSRPIAITVLILGILTIAAAIFGAVNEPSNYWNFFLVFVGVFITVREIFILARWNRSHTNG